VFLFHQHLSNLWQCYYEDLASAAEGLALYKAKLSANLDERARPSDKLIYSYYESIASNKVKCLVVLLIAMLFLISIAYETKCILDFGYTIICNILSMEKTHALFFSETALTVSKNSENY